MKPRLLFFLTVLSISFLGSCIKEEDIDFTNLSVSDWKPDLALPLVNSSFRFDDIAGLTDSGEVYVDSDGRIVIVSTSSLFSRTAAEFLTIPDQSAPSTLTITSALASAINAAAPYDTVSNFLNNNYSLNTSSSIQISSLLVKSGSLELVITNPTPLKGTVVLLINQLTKNNLPFTRTIPIPANNTFGISTDISGYNLLPGSNNQVAVNYAINLTKGGSSVTVSPGPQVSVNANFRSITYYSVFGNFGSQVFSIPLDSAKLDLYSRNPNDSFAFSDPSIYVDVVNSVGMPFRVSNISLQPIGDNGQLIPFTTSVNQFSVNSPGSVGQNVTSTAVVNRSNSDIVNAMSLRPEYVSYFANVATNIPTSNNFITDSSRFDAKLRVELPLDGWATRFTVQDTSDFQLDNIDEVDSLVFRLDIRNGFPAGAYTQVYFADSNGLVLETLIQDPTQQLIGAAGVDANGYAISPTERFHDEPFNHERIQRIIGCTKLIVYSIINTTDSGVHRAVKFTDSDKLDVKLGVRARLKVSLN